MNTAQPSPEPRKQPWPANWDSLKQAELAHRLAYLGIEGETNLIAIANDIERHQATIDDLERYIKVSRSLSSSIVRVQEQRAHFFTPLGRFYASLRASEGAGWAEVLMKYTVITLSAIPLWIACAPFRAYFQVRKAYYKSKHREWFGDWLAAERRGY